jgi:hypothetical protein
MGMLEDDLTQFPPKYEERPRKMHLFRDQGGATYKSMGRELKYADTACRGNYAGPELVSTSDVTKVTCKNCLKKIAEPERMPTPERLTVPEAAPKANRFRYRRSWRGKLILQICETKHYMKDLNGSGYYDEWSKEVWRDATLADLGVGVA